MRSGARLSRLVPALFLGVGVLGCSFTETEEGALGRGDQAWARGDYQEALAEYRVALRQGSDEATIQARIAHAYARLGRLDETRDHYAEAIRADSAWVDQAVSDLVRLARSAEARSDRFEVASALQAALELQPGVAVEDLALPLARHHARNGEYGQALPYFQMALRAAGPDSTPEVLFETAMAHAEIGDCRRALVFFEQYRDMISRQRRSEVDWHIGNCSYRLAMDIREGRDRGPLLVDPDSARPDPLDRPDTGRVRPGDGRPPRTREARNQEALRLVERTIVLGEPKNLLAPAYFEKGEILSERGECDAAIEAFRRVLLVDAVGTGPLVSRSQERIDQIRFGPRPGDPSLFRRRRRDRDGEEEGAGRLTPCGTPLASS